MILKTKELVGLYNHYPLGLIVCSDLKIERREELTGGAFCNKQSAANCADQIFSKCNSAVKPHFL